MLITDPFTCSTNTTIRLIRKSLNGTDADSDTDDRIAIVHEGEDTYSLYYRDSDMKNKTSCHYKILDGAELDTYIENLFFLLTRDKDPFRSIQFNIPCMPGFIFTIDDLKSKGLRKALNYTLPLLKTAYKVKPTSSKTPRFKNTHLIFE